MRKHKGYDEGYSDGVADTKAEGRKAVVKDIRTLIRDGHVCVIALDKGGEAHTWTYGEIPEMVAGWVYLQVCRATLELRPFSDLIREVR